VPTNSFIASAAAVVRAGARPVLVDCDDEYQLIDPGAAASAISPRTRAIIPVHLFGQLAPMEVLAEMAEPHGVAIIEDAAQCHGAHRNGQRAGAWGVAAATSFYPGKNLGAYGDGGAVATNDSGIASRVAALRNHGGQAKYEHPTLGFNCRLDTLQAVVLLAKLVRLDAWNASRRAAADRYNGLLGGIPDVRLPQVLPGNEHVWHLYVIRVPNRDRVLAHLRSAGVGVGIHYPVPIHLQGAFASLGYGPGSFPVAEQAASEILSLPMHPHLTASQQQRVADVLDDALR
jgi:dTDP-4-amino-4,6-dideoxygalactose transaminase